MNGPQNSERMTDEHVQQKVASWLPTIQTWYGWLSEGRPVPQGSELAADDAAGDTEFPLSRLALSSLGIATDHLGTVCYVLTTSGPTVFSLKTLLRTAMLGGAQAIWLLAPDSRQDRLTHARQIRDDSYLNQLYWVNGMEKASSEVLDPNDRQRLTGYLTGALGGSLRFELKPTRMIEFAAEYVYTSPADPSITAECLAAWRIASSVAHALPWEQNVRTSRRAAVTAHQRTTALVASWSELQGALSFSYAFIDVAWRLLRQRANAILPAGRQDGIDEGRGS